MTIEMVGIHWHADHAFIIEVQQIRPLGEYAYAARLVKLQWFAEATVGVALEMPLIAANYGRTAEQAEDQMVCAVKAYLDGKFVNNDGYAAP